MRFFLLLAAVVAAVEVSGSNPPAQGAMPFQMPSPFVDGTIITFFFWHASKIEDADKVVIDFYTQPTDYSWQKDGIYDLPAKIIITRDELRPVETNTFQYGLWWKDIGDKFDQRLTTMPPTRGWWRVDLIKMNSRFMNIYFQGFWSGTREFGMSLDGIQSAYVDSTYMDPEFVEMIVKTADPNLPYRPVTKPLAKINNFPIGSRIELIAVLSASDDPKTKLPSLHFGPNSAKDFDNIFFTVSQSWNEQNFTATLFFGFGTHSQACINGKPNNGDLQHLQLERISKGVIRMQVMHHPAAANMDKFTCDLVVPPSLWSHMDLPFYILSDYGAGLFHVEQSIPQPLSIHPTL